MALILLDKSSRLVGPEFVVGAFAGDEFGVRAVFDDATVFPDHDAIEVLDRAQTVGDDKRRAPEHKFFERLLDIMLASAVERTGCLVEDDNGRIFEHGAGDRDTLALSA